MTGKHITYIGLAVLLTLMTVVGSCSSMYVLDEYERGVVTRMGEFNETTGPGFHLKTPFMEEVHVADTRINKISYPELVVATEDGQIITVDLTINHRINEAEANLRSLYEQFGNSFNYEPRILRELAIDRVKSVMGGYKMENFMASRDEIRQRSLTAVKQAVEPYGIHIVDVQISNLGFGKRYKDRLEQVAEQRAKAAEAKQIARQESFKADQAIERARGQAESAKKIADAKAYQQRVQAEAEAHARKVRSVEDAAAIEREGQAKAAALKVQADALASAESSALVELTKAEAMKNWDGSSTPQIIMQGGEGNGTSMIPFMNMSQMAK